MAAVAPKTNKEHDLGTSTLRWGTVYSGDMNLDGNLTISGTVASIDVTTLVVNEEYIKVGDANAADILDLGLIAQYASDGTKYSVLFRDATDSKWKLATGLTTEPTAGSTVALGEDTGATLVVGTFEGNLIGNVTGTIQTAAQANITSVGTLTALQVDNINVDANTITASTGALNLTPAAGSAIVLDGTINVDAGVVTGATSITSTNFVGNITGDVTGNASGTALTVTQAAQTAITSVGTLTALDVDNVNVNGNTISASSGALNLTPEAGSAIVLDGTINVDAGVVTGATSITSTNFVGNVTGNTSGTAATVTEAAQANITSVGTLTALQVDNVNIDGSTISSSGALNLTPAGGSAIVLDGTINVDAGVVTGATSITSTNFVGNITGNVTGTSSLVTVADSTANTAFPVVFNDESNALLDDTGSLTYNPSSGELVVTSVASNKLSVDQDGTGVNSAGSVTLGAGNDAALWVASDDLYIQNDTNDKDIVFSINNDSSAGTEVMRITGANKKVTIEYDLKVEGKLTGGASSTIEFDGGVKHTVFVPGEDDALDSSMYLVRTAYNITIPRASLNAGREFIITCIASSKNLTCEYAGDNLYYSADKTAASDGTDLTSTNDIFAMRDKTMYRIISDGANWYIV